ncbi:MAG: hypothetical protein ACRD9R_06730 [Pyrinomonadaceae bacterium]
MAETPADSDALVKREPEDAAATPARDPITSRSSSSILLVCALLLMGSLGWALLDEVYLQRPWKSYQREFVARFDRYLKSLRKRDNATEKAVKESPEYQQLAAEVEVAKQSSDPQVKEIDRQVGFIDAQLGVITEPFQNKRGAFTVVSYEIETADESDKPKLRRELEEMKQEPEKIEVPAAPGSKETKEEQLNFAQLEERYNQLKLEKARLLSERVAVRREYDELERKRQTYVKDNVIGLTPVQIGKLIDANEKFAYEIKQINVNEADVVDRCETCHLGTRQPLRLTPAMMKPAGRGKRPDDLARAFTSHPSQELLRIHNVERFGCASCHWGNGRATTSEEKGHGRHRFWLHPMFKRENMEAGCQQCHSSDRVLDGAPNLNLGKDLFYERGCVGCHRAEGFDRDADALAGARQSVKQLEEQQAANERESRQLSLEADNASDDTEAQRLRGRAVALRVTNSQLDSRIEQFNQQARYLMLDQKKLGPNLKDLRLKMGDRAKGWIPEWLKDPQAFRPGTKMPTFWYLNPASAHLNKDRAEDERKAIAAYLWQSAFDPASGGVPKQQPGNATHGEELFKTVGCMACHSIGVGDQSDGGDFAANLQRVGEKADFSYIVRWIYEPRERWAPYCPKEKRDLTRADYDKKKLPFVFDSDRHSKCPNDGAELQVQNMTVMPNFRLSESDARDIATYLFSLSGQQANWPDASFMDDPKLKDQGFNLIKQYGCAGCHEIKGFEEEQRIGKELTTEGATPLERLDFATLTHDAERGIDPWTGTTRTRDDKKKGEWYDRRGFFEHKLEEPGIYDKGKEKDPREHLKMPKPHLVEDGEKQERTALVTFLLGSVGAEGANVPASMFYKPDEQRKAIQDGWWVIKKYNCMGCHGVQVGQKSDLSQLALFQTPEGKEQLPPDLTTEGARVDPDWLLRFLTDPSLSGADFQKTAASHTSASGGGRGGATQTAAATNGAQSPVVAVNGGTGTNGATTAASGGSPNYAPQPGANRNGVRLYLKPRMPTFHFSPNELRTLVRFFMAVSAQQEPYIKEESEPLTTQELQLARDIFTSTTAPCLKCHLNGNAEHDLTASAPNFLQAGERLKPGWTFRWLLDPQRIIPGTAMPSDLFRREGERWVFNATQLPASASGYEGDHARLLVRYMLQLTPDEQRRIASGSTSAPTAAPTPAQTNGEANDAAPTAASTGGMHHGGPPPRRSVRRRKKSRPRAFRAVLRGRGAQIMRKAAQQQAAPSPLAAPAPPVETAPGEFMYW